MSGALNASDLVVPLSFKTSLLAVLALPRMVTSPETVAAPESRVPDIRIVVLPLTTALLSVPPLMAGVEIVLFVRVSAASLVAMIPLLGKVAVEASPEPPRLVGKMPVTAEGWARLIALKEGAPPPTGTVRL